jgi:hypothetical protein
MAEFGNEICQLRRFALRKTMSFIAIGPSLALRPSKENHSRPEIQCDAGDAFVLGLVRSMESVFDRLQS